MEGDLQVLPRDLGPVQSLGGLQWGFKIRYYEMHRAWPLDKMNSTLDGWTPASPKHCTEKCEFFVGKKNCGKGNLKWFGLWFCLKAKPQILMFSQQFDCSVTKNTFYWAPRLSPAQNKQLAKIIKFDSLTVVSKLCVSAARYVSHPHGSQKRPPHTNGAAWGTHLTQGSHTPHGKGPHHHRRCLGLWIWWRSPFWGHLQSGK